MATVPVPRTWVASEFPSAATLNGTTGIRDAMNFILDPPRCRVYQGTTGTACASGTTTVLPFDTEDADTDTMHDTATNPSRLIATTAGRYLIIAMVTVPANATGIRVLSLRKNAAGSAAGGSFLTGNTDSAPPTGTYIGQVTWEEPLLAGDYVEAFFNQTSGGSLTTSLGVNATAIIMRRVSA